MAERYNFIPLSSAGSTRLLLLQPSKADDSPLRCELKEVNVVDNAPICAYEALSYVWGSRTAYGELRCNRGSIPLARNCESALRHLRRRRTTTVLWVDAVCINQQDDRERAQQISLMGSIHRFATSVVIWLGEGTKNTARCFARLKFWRTAIKSGLFFRKLNGNKVWGQMVFRRLSGSIHLHGGLD